MIALLVLLSGPLLLVDKNLFLVIFFFSMFLIIADYTFFSLIFNEELRRTITFFICVFDASFSGLEMIKYSPYFNVAVIFLTIVAIWRCIKILKDIKNGIQPRGGFLENDNASNFFIITILIILVTFLCFARPNLIHIYGRINGKMISIGVIYVLLAALFMILLDSCLYNYIRESIKSNKKK